MEISINSTRQTKTKTIIERKGTTGLAQVRKWSGKKILQVQGKVREFDFEPEKNWHLKESQGNLI